MPFLRHCENCPWRGEKAAVSRHSLVKVLSLAMTQAETGGRDGEVFRARLRLTRETYGFTPWRHGDDGPILSSNHVR